MTGLSLPSPQGLYLMEPNLGHNVRYKVMEPFIHCCVSLEIKSLDASDAKLFAVKVKWSSTEVELVRLCPLGRQQQLNCI